jgi:hypothetical protein
MMPPLTDDSRFSAVDDLVYSELDGEVVLLHLKSGVYYGLDEVGSRIWSLLRESRTLKEILETLLHDYDVSPRQCEDDLRALLSRLWEAGLIEPKGAGPE